MKAFFSKMIWLSLTSILVAGTFFFHANAFAELKTEILKPEIAEAQKQTEDFEHRARKLKRNIADMQRKSEDLGRKMRDYKPKITNFLRPRRSDYLKHKMRNLNIKPKITNSLSPVRTENLEYRARKLNQGIADTQRKAQNLERKMRERNLRQNITNSPIGGGSIYQSVPRLDSLELNRNSLGSFGR
jgi:peptidoglycan hydrolase CwlO-like protein